MCSIKQTLAAIRTDEQEKKTETERSIKGLLHKKKKKRATATTQERKLQDFTKTMAGEMARVANLERMAAAHAYADQILREILSPQKQE